MDQPDQAPPAKKPKKRINYALGATLVAAGVPLAEIAAKVGAKNANTLRVGLQRKGVSVTMSRALPAQREIAKALLQPAAMSATAQVAAQAGEIMRERLSNQLSATMGVLERIKPGSSMKAAAQRAAILEPLARTSKITYNWDAQSGSQRVSMTVLGDLSIAFPTPQESSDPPIDIPHIVVPAESSEDNTPK